MTFKIISTSKAVKTYGQAWKQQFTQLWKPRVRVHIPIQCERTYEKQRTLILFTLGSVDITSASGAEQTTETNILDRT